MIREIISEDEKYRVKHIYKTDDENVIKEHINNALIKYIVQKIKEDMWKILLFWKLWYNIIS